MISSIFERTNPLNFVILFLFLVFFSMGGYLLSIDFVVDFQAALYLIKCLIVVFLSLFMVDFIVRKNQLTQRNSFTIFFFVLLFCLFPRIFNKLDQLMANFFLLLAFRRIISVRSNKNIEIKIFDATLWIFVATYFYSWSILFLILVYTGIVLFKKNDYRNMLIPLVSFGAVAIIGFTYYFLTDQLQNITEIFQFDFGFNVEKYSSLRYLVAMVFMCFMGAWASVMFLLKKQSKSFRTRVPGILVFMGLTIGIVVVLLSETSDSSEFVFILFPLSIIQAKYVERIKTPWLKEMILWLYIGVPVLVLFL